MKWLRRVFVALLGLVLLLAAGLAGGWVWLRTGLPEHEATVAVNGVAAPVRIVRDAHAVPHIFAESESDVAYALGFVHAQDRFFQMEMARRLGAGRLAEVLGASALPADRFMRIVGIYHLAEASYADLPAEVRTQLDRYAAGVNAWLAHHEGPWPPELYVLGIEPEPWRPADSLVLARLMALQLSMNYRDELTRARILDHIGIGPLSDLFPNADLPEVTTIGALPDALLPGEAVARLHAALPMPGPPGASNAWVVAGDRTETGAPILVNDPHLGLTAPILWYLVRIVAPDLTLAGATIPGAPMVVLGHNGTIAWGLTTTGSDTQDLFIERLDPDAPGRYLTPGGSAPFEAREEIIEVAWGEPEALTVRRTRHGPVISDARPAEAAAALGDDAVLALAFPGLSEADVIAEAMYRLNRARDWTDFRAALAHWVAPQQNVFYADTGGDIGMVAPARVPIRSAGNGLVPVPGWTGDNSWTGFIPYEDLPAVRNPPSGRIVNANNPVVGPDYPYLIAAYQYEAPYRALRIHEMLDAADPAQSVEGMLPMLMDSLSLAARDLLPLMLAFAPADDRTAEAVAMLRAWDHIMDSGRPEPLLFTAWLLELNQALYADELGLAFPEYQGLHARTVRHMLTDAPRWCDDLGTEGVPETCPDVLARSLADTLDALTTRYGADMTSWRWGDAHVATLTHRVFGRIPVLRNLVDRSVATDGGEYTVNRGGMRPVGSRPFRHVHGAGFRAVYDLSDLDNSRFIIATGQSGNPLSPHFGDLVETWREGGTITLTGSAAELAQTGLGTLTLVPEEP
jgi:penicillin amidase